MSRFHKALMAAIAALTLILSQINHVQHAAAATKGSYTILVYMNGSDLESKNGGTATRDLAEMIQAGSTDQVNVLVETLGTAKWTAPFMASDRNQRWRVVQGDLTLVDDTVGRRDLADPDTLKDFILWGMKNYQAERYALIFWDHGGGLVYGYGKDETNPENPSLSLQGIAKGIGDALAITGERFELIGFDTCLLAATELASLLSPNGRYLVASEETEPSHGWNYTPVLQAIHDDPTITGDRLGQVIAEQFKAQAERYKTQNGITLSVIDLTNVPAGVEAWQQSLAAIDPAIKAEPGMRSLQKARYQAESYGAGADMVDLTDLVTKASSLAPAEAEALISRIKEAVVYNLNSVGTPRASGLSIYFPEKGKQQIDSTLTQCATAGFSQPYQEFLTRYASVALGDNQPVQLAAASPSPTATEGRSTRYTVQVKADQADEVAGIYSILGMVAEANPDEIILIAYDNNVDFDPETGEIADTFTESVVTLNGHYVAMYLEDEGDRYDRYVIPMELNGKDVSLIVLYDYETDQDVIVGAWPGLDAGSHMAQKDLILIKPGDRITPLFEFYNEKTGETGHYEGEAFTVKGKLNLGYTDVPEGTYLYGVDVVDFAGNESFSDFTEVEVTYAEDDRPTGESWEEFNEEAPALKARCSSHEGVRPGGLRGRGCF